MMIFLQIYIKLFLRSWILECTSYGSLFLQSITIRIFGPMYIFDLLRGASIVWKRSGEIPPSRTLTFIRFVYLCNITIRPPPAGLDNIYIRNRHFLGPWPPLIWSAHQLGVKCRTQYSAFCIMLKLYSRICKMRCKLCRLASYTSLASVNFVHYRMKWFVGGELVECSYEWF